MVLVTPEFMIVKRELSPVRKHLLDNAEWKNIILLLAGVF